MRRFGQFLSASLKMTFREKVALFWLFLFPVLLMLLLGSIFGRSGQANINLGIVDLDGSSLSGGVVSALENIDAFILTKGEEDRLKSDLRDGKLNAVLVLNEGFMESLEQGHAAGATIHVDQSSATVADITYSSVSQVLDEIARGMAGMPDLIEVERESVTSSEMSYVDFIVPGVLAMTLMSTGMFGLSLAFVQYREKGILRRIKVSPLPLSRFLGSELTAALILSVLQAVVLLAVGKLVFKVHMRGNLLYVTLLVVLGAASFLALGFMVASLSKTLKTAEMTSNALTFPMMFLSGVFFPLSVMPAALAFIARLLPLYYLGHALREVMIMGKPIWSVWVDIVVLAGVGLACFLVSVKLFRWE